jgi:hypothetical protein
LLLIDLLTVAVCASSSNEGIALLRAVESARRQIKQGSLKLTVTYHTQSADSKREFRVRFSGDKVRFDGLDTRSSLIHDGRTTTTYDGVQSVTVDDPMNQSKTPWCLFDPRTLGINATYHLDRGLDQCLAYKNAKSVRVVGAEEIQGTSAMHVEVMDSFDQRHEFWIDRASPFRVLKYSFDNGHQTRQVSLSTYEPGGVLPSKVVVEWLNEDGSLRVEKRMVTARELQLNDSIDPQEFTLAAIATIIPPGTPVADLRMKQRLGYFIGEGDQLANAVPESIAFGHPHGGTADNSGSRVRLIAIAANVILIAAILVLWRLRRSWKAS